MESEGFMYLSDSEALFAIVDTKTTEKHPKKWCQNDHRPNKNADSNKGKSSVSSAQEHLTCMFFMVWMGTLCVTNTPINFLIFPSYLQLAYFPYSYTCKENHTGWGTLHLLLISIQSQIDKNDPLVIKYHNW